MSTADSGSRDAEPDRPCSNHDLTHHITATIPIAKKATMHTYPTNPYIPIIDSCIQALLLTV